MDLYLHIGTEKTGTTSVQEFFRANRPLLKEHDVLYPLAPGFANQTALAMMAHEDLTGALARLFSLKTDDDLAAFRADLSGKLDRELREQNWSKVVMSSEHCSSRLITADEIEALRDFLKPWFARIYIVVYIRRQDDFVVSSYSTAIKTGSSQALKLPGGKLLRDRYDYWELLLRWSQVFGRDSLICRRFEISSLTGGDVVDDFLTVTGLDKLGVTFQRPRNYNESLDASEIEFLRVFNKFRTGIRKRKLMQCLSEVSTATRVDLTEEERTKLMDAVRESNRRVAIEYFGGEAAGSDDPLFAPRRDDQERVTQRPISIEQAVEIAAKMWTWNEERGKRRAAARSAARAEAGEAGEAKTDDKPERGRRHRFLKATRETGETAREQASSPDEGEDEDLDDDLYSLDEDVEEEAAGGV